MSAKAFDEGDGKFRAYFEQQIPNLASPSPVVMLAE
jgi:hypothetical protein